MKRAGILLGFAVAAILVGPGVAGAGIVIDHRDTTPLPFGGSMYVVQAADGTQIAVGDDSTAPVLRINWSERVGSVELKQIQDGVITSEEAQSGCGASASSGTAAGLPLALAALALIGARRRRRSRSR